VRSGPWKLLLPHTYTSVKGQAPGRDGKPGKSVGVTLERPELYDLAADPNETTDVARKHPEVVAKVMQHAEAFRQELGDSLTKRVGRGVREPGREP
jgi:arylsulfatase